MRISDWSSDVCSSDLDRPAHRMARDIGDAAETRGRRREHRQYLRRQIVDAAVVVDRTEFEGQRGGGPDGHGARQAGDAAVADIGGGRKAGAVDEIRLDIAPAAVRDRKAGVEEAAALVAETHPGFPGADLVVEEAPHEIPVDGEAAGAGIGR